jgi:3-oxoacyl-[acyl-carrier protein] reductase
MAQDIYSGRVALVTGSRRGVGRVICEHFLQQGGSVIGLARGEATLAHASYRHFQVDLTQPAAIEQTFFALRKEFPTLHILVNNAGVLLSQHALIMPTSGVRNMIDTNLVAPFFVSREAAKLMRKEKWGRIINIGSMASSLEPVGDSVYAACKAGLRTMGNVLAKELASFNITVNTLAISAIETDMLAQLPREQIRSVIGSLPIPRFATADDILNVIDFFASERSAYITAQTIFLGGVN